MYIIKKQFAFEAAHHLKNLPDEHPCSRPHGHSYRVEVILRSEGLDQAGFVRDYRELDELKQYIDTHFDHHDLNDVLPVQTSAENIARHFFFFCRERWSEVIAVSVSETQKSWATYMPNGGVEVVAQ